MSLLKSKPIPTVVVNNAHNIVNGNDAEMLAAAKVLMACGGEVRWGSRNEDGRKIDFIISQEHPWIPGEALIILFQVKSGDTFGALDGSNGFELFPSAIKKAQRTSHDICVIWVERNEHKLFWAYIHPNSKSSKQKYGKQHIINPSLKYDLARCSLKAVKGNIGGKGIILNSNIVDYKKERAAVRIKFLEFRGSNIINPALGKIEFSAIGWRHMFRKSRSKKNKNKSIIILNNIDSILKQTPTKTYISKCEITTEKNFHYRNTEFILKYDEVKILNEQKVLVTTPIIIRLKEEIRWPENWSNNSTLTQLVDRRVVIFSCHYK